ncbi:LysR substrate-binding domain-containing protein [Nitrospirillum iridis]|uniref:DNA-binding transcriptional LysR family regulator n=1 Tax=Nitrospirillum iridis TaxID=765888 RepID=A0A7X0EDA9_9PROT|nr:DNA-binding transcriptional LysR family regulator [Nitrospirillum iridis]
MKLNLRALEAFRLTLATGSGSAAARQLGISQPAVSRLIARLQNDVGFDLFYRERGRLVATPEALILSNEVEAALARLDQVASLARNIGQLDIGELRIVGPPSLVEGALAPVIAGFLNKHPKLKAVIHPRDVDTTKEMVATKEAECGFAKLPINHAGIRAEVLVVSETACVLPPGHPLMDHDIITPAELRNVPLVVLGQGRWPRTAIDAQFHKAGIAPHVRLETQSVGSACAFAAQGVGVAIVNEFMARDHAWRGVHIRTFRPQILHKYAFITASAAPMAKVTEAFLIHCRNALKMDVAAE